jgi:hypothetical protein
MTNVLNGLMAGGDASADCSIDNATPFELWLEDMEASASAKSIPELEILYFDAFIDEDVALAEVYKSELSRRGYVFAPSPAPCGTLDDEPYWLSDPSEEDRHKEYLENYAAEAVGLETDQLPF